MALPATDTFTTGSNAALQTYSSNWTINGGSFNVLAASDDVYPAAVDENGAHWNADTFNAAQYAQVAVNARGDGYIGPAVRCAASANTLYQFYLSQSSSYVAKVVAGSWTQLGSTGGGCTVGRTYRLEASGTTITPKENGTTFASVGAQTDSAISSGYAGLCGYANDSAARVDNWEGGNLSSGTAYNQSAAGTLTPAGATSKRAAKRPAGTLTSAGAMARSARKIVAGTLTSAGTAVRRAAKGVAGTLTSSGALTTSLVYVVSLAGTLTSAGALTRRTAKGVAGTVATAGVLTRQAAKAVAGALASAGALVADFLSGSATYSQAAGGTLAAAGALARQTNKTTAGAMTMAGAITRRIAKTFAGTLATAGAVLRSWISPSAAKLDVTLADARVYTATLTDARVYTATLTDARVNTATLKDATV